MSRGDAKKLISMDSYVSKMKDIYSTSVSMDTIDEAPQAYKNADEIIELVQDTVDINGIIKPLYNFKA